MSWKMLKATASSTDSRAQLTLGRSCLSLQGSLGTIRSAAGGWSRQCRATRPIQEGQGKDKERRGRGVGGGREHREHRENIGNIGRESEGELPRHARASRGWSPTRWAPACCEQLDLEHPGAPSRHQVLELLRAKQSRAQHVRTFRGPAAAWPSSAASECGLMRALMALILRSGVCWSTSEERTKTRGASRLAADEQMHQIQQPWARGLTGTFDLDRAPWTRQTRSRTRSSIGCASTAAKASSDGIVFASSRAHDACCEIPAAVQKWAQQHLVVPCSERSSARAQLDFAPSPHGHTHLQPVPMCAACSPPEIFTCQYSCHRAPQPETHGRPGDAQAKRPGVLILLLHQ